MRSGDTLWDLARQYLGDPYRWPDIFQVNRGQVANPHLILPDWWLRIPGAPLQAAPAAVEASAVSATGDRTVFFENGHPTGGPELQFATVAEAPAVTTGDFYRAGMLIREDVIAPVGQLAELVNPSMVPLKIPPQIGLYDQVFLPLGTGQAVKVGDRLHLLRPDGSVRGWGRIFQPTGIARVVAVDGQVATVEVETLYDAVRVGDWAVPLSPFSPPLGRMRVAAEQRLEGRILAFQNPHPLQNLQDVAFVDLGETSGVEEGDELVAVLPPERRSWGLRPEIVVARLRVVRTAQQTAAVKVIELEQPALRPGLPVRLVTKMR